MLVKHAATTVSAIVTLVASAFAATGAMGATSGAPAAPQVRVGASLPKIQCAGYGEQVTIQNVGTVPVPARTIVEWTLPKATVEGMGATSVVVDAQSGFYMFQQPLNAGQQIQINAPPPTGSQGGQPADPSALLLAIGGLRSCTIAYSTLSAMLAHVQSAHIAAVIPAAPTGLSATRSNPSTVLLTWTGGSLATHFDVFDVTTSSNPPSDYRSWHNAAVVAGNVFKASVSIPSATKPQANYYMVCATNAGSSIVKCSSPVTETLAPIVPMRGP
jgi:hypothetical protein